MGWRNAGWLGDDSGWYKNKASSSFIQGIYFRATNNQVSPSNYDVEIATTQNYPRTSAQGNLVGWDNITTLNSADLDITTDVRLKGIIFGGNAGTARYRITLPSPGIYKVRAALGANNVAHPERLRIFDNGTLLSDLDAGDVPGNQWADATGVIRTSEANWVSGNAQLTLTFTTTVAQFQIGGSTGTSDVNTTIAALEISS